MERIVSLFTLLAASLLLTAQSFSIRLPDTLSKKSLDGRLLLLFSKNHSAEPRFQITDNGIGIIESMKHKDESHTSTGIDNIQKRIALLNQKYHMSSSLTITDRSTLDGTAQGTIAELVLLIEFE